jgi:hypothetical protein
LEENPLDDEPLLPADPLLEVPPVEVVAVPIDDRDELPPLLVPLLCPCTGETAIGSPED